MFFVLNALVAVLLLTIAYFLPRALSKHKLSIGHISLLDFALHLVRYQGTLYNDTYHIRFSCARAYIRFHIPRRPNPRWMTFTVEETMFASETCDISVGQLSVTFWFFPMFFRQTAGPWTNVELQDFRIRVMRSNATPYWVKRLRQNLVGAVVAGEILRMDDFGTSVLFQTTKDKYERSEDIQEEREAEADGVNGAAAPAECERCDSGDECCHTRTSCGTSATLDPIFKKDRRLETAPFMNRDEDEVRVTAYARGLRLHNCKGRIYSFDGVDAQLRRNWTADRGTFVMVAEECRWIRVPLEAEMERTLSWWRYVFTYDFVSHYL